MPHKSCLQWQPDHFKYNFDVREGKIFTSWFKGATTNIAYNCLVRMRQVSAARACLGPCAQGLSAALASCLSSVQQTLGCLQRQSRSLRRSSDA